MGRWEPGARERLHRIAFGEIGDRGAREVVFVREVHDGVGRAGSGSQALEVVKIAALHGRAFRLQGVGG